MPPLRKIKVRRARRPAGVAGLGIKRILVPLDFSETAGNALEYAVALAVDMQAKIILMHVREPVYISAEPGLTYIPQETALEKNADGIRLHKIAAEFIPDDLFDKAIVGLGTPYHEIATAARRLKAGLIVLTTHGRTGLGHVLMGSTAERVVRHAPCPVLTVRRLD